MRRSLFSVAILLTLLLGTGPLLAGPTLAVLEFHKRGGEIEGTRQTADQLRDELRRLLGSGVVSKQQTEDIFFYHYGLLEDDPNRLNGLFSEGKRAYYELRFSDAEQAFRRVIPQAREEMLIEAHLLLGLVSLATDQPAEADFREAARLDPTRRLDPRLFPPRALRLFESVNKRRFEEGSLEVETDPVGADLYVNGVFRGVTPLKIPHLPAGTHTIRIQAGHYDREIRSVELKPGQKQRIDVTLRWQSRERPPVLGFREEDLEDMEGLNERAAVAGSVLGVRKILLVALSREGETWAVDTRLVDSDLKGSPPLQRFFGEPSRGADGLIGQVAEAVSDQLGDDLIASQDTSGRYQGDLLLLSQPRPFYKRPLFWVLVGTAGTGGALAAALGGSAASLGTIGVVFQ